MWRRRSSASRGACVAEVLDRGELCGGGGEGLAEGHVMQSCQ